MYVKQFLMEGSDRNYGYLAADETTKKAFVVDPSYSPKQITEYAAAEGYSIEYCFITHNHFDHTENVERMETLAGVTPVLFGGVEKKTGITLADGAELPLGGTSLMIIHTPGHTKDCMCILAGDALFTGDTLFVGKVGGTGLGDDAKAEFESLHGKILLLPDDTRVFPGHNYGTAPESTIGNEKATNPFLLQPDLESFVHLKANWAQYKEEHGIT